MDLALFSSETRKEMRPQTAGVTRALLHLVTAVLLLSVPVSAQTILNFSRVVSGSYVFTDLAVGNPTAGAVTFTAYGSDGSLLNGAGVENPLTVEVAAGGQLLRMDSELFGAADFNDWVQAASATSGLTGFFLNANPAVTDLDGALALSAEVEYVLPFAVEDGSDGGELGGGSIDCDADAVRDGWESVGDAERDFGTEGLAATEAGWVVC